jgi:hypothetical protein
MAEEKKAPNVFQKIAKFTKETVEWTEATFSDPVIATEIREDLGLNTENPATPAAIDPQVRSKIDEFVAKQDVDEQALAQTIAQIQALVETGMTFADAVKAEGADAWDVLWLMFKVWVADSLRVRNPSAYALCALAGLITEEEDTLAQLDPEPLMRLLRGQATADDTEALIERISALAGLVVVGLDNAVKAVDGRIDAVYGWDPEPDNDPETAVVASRALTVVFHIPSLDEVRPALTIIGVPRSHGGPGLFLSLSAHLQVSTIVGSTQYTVDAGANGAFGMFVPLAGEAQDLRAFGGGTPSFGVKAEPDPAQPGRPALVLGTSNATRLEIGALAWGVEIGADHAGFRLAARRGKLVVSLDDGDGFLRNLPGARVEVPFDIGVLADTEHGIRIDGGTGLKVNLPVAASVLGIFTVQYVELELVLDQDPTLDLVGGFALRLGPFQASVDKIGLAVDLDALADGMDDLGALVRFAPPKGIGLSLDTGVVKGGGYLFIDAQRGEYAGALELRFLSFSIKAIALITTRRPDGSEGWSLLIMVYGQFKVHIAFGIFWTGLGGMIGLHHRADTDALVAGMRTGALDDVLFPADPVADAPRIINRYKQLFPIEADSLLLGPMLELSFSEPPIVYVRLGLLFEVRNALGGDRPAALTKIVLLGQLLVQLPPKALGAPAILKLLVDIVGFYDVDQKFLLIRARLRDSFVGIEGFAKLNLSGELLLAMRFAEPPSFVLSAGGFHPAFSDVPAGVPRDLQRLAVSFKVGPIQMRAEEYFAITSNSVQGGCKIEVKADFGVASIEGWLSFDALFYLSPQFHFLVNLGFHVAVRAFGTNLMSVDVRMSLEGPGEWHAVGTFSFSILWWDVDVDFDERWGSAPAVDPGAVSAAAALLADLGDASRLEPSGPIGGASLVTLAPAAGATVPLAHPLGQLTVRQKAVPLDVRIDRIGTKRLTEGTPTFRITKVLVGPDETPASAPVTDHFARGQYMELSEQEKLEGRSFERFTCGVVVGTERYSVPARGGTSVTASYERKLLEPQPRLNFHWRLLPIRPLILDFSVAGAIATVGAAGRSTRARTGALVAEPIGRATVQPLELAMVAADSLKEVASLTAGALTSPAVATQLAEAAGARVVEVFEVTP